MTQRNTETATQSLKETLTILGKDANGTDFEISYSDARRASALSWYDFDTMLDTLERAGMVSTTLAGQPGMASDTITVKGL